MKNYLNKQIEEMRALIEKSENADEIRSLGTKIDEAKAELNGVTLESLVVAERVARAIKLNIKKGTLKAEDFPLLLHIDEIISDKKDVNIPWEKFTFEK